MRGINFVGTGVYLPENIIKNDDFAAIVDTNDEWITTRTGMKERRFSNSEPTWYMGALAAKQAIENANISPNDIGIIIASSVTPDYAFPSLSCIIQREVGAIGSIAFDINCACSGYVYGIDMAYRYLSTSTFKYALVVGSENLTKLVDYTDRSSCVLFGDGAAACIIKYDENFYKSFLGADGNGAKHMSSSLSPVTNPFTTKSPEDFPTGIPQLNGNHIYMDGKEVYKFATKALPDAILHAIEGTDLSVEDIDIFIPHQANIRIIETAAKNIGVSIDKFYTNIHKYGNTSSASIGLALHEAILDGSLKRGDTACLVGFGAGLTYGAIIFKY